jgi:nucleoside-diphosphate-sugar epimerase
MAIVNWPSLHGDAFRGVRALVTGGAGFIGSHLSEALLILGASVVVIDDLSGGDVSNLRGFGSDVGDRLQFVEGSIGDRQLIDRVTTGCTFVFHQAAWGSVPRSVELPMRYHEINTTGTANGLESARSAGVKRVIFAASSSAYGDSETLPKIETMPVRPKSPYAATKVAGEAMMRAYASCYPLDTASLRYFNIFGPRQNANSAYAAVIAAFARALHAGEAPIVHGDGEQSRDFTFVDNAVHANLLAARCQNRVGGEVMNVACGARVTVNELASKMAGIYGRPDLKAVHAPQRAGDVKHSLADLHKTQSVIGYSPVVDLDQGLAVTCQWYRQVMSSPAVKD